MPTPAPDPLSSSQAPVVRVLDAPGEPEIEALAGLLVDCVEGGASVGFMWPFEMDESRAFWRRVATGVADGARLLLVAEVDGAIVGTVQLVVEQPPNQPHRADLAKMLVRRSARRQGIGAALMDEAERVARSRGKTLLVLDTASDAAERLYARAGWIACGTIPGFALLPQGGPCATTFFYRELT